LLDETQRELLDETQRELPDETQRELLDETQRELPDARTQRNWESGSDWPKWLPLLRSAG
jgi:hypothetical protein